MTSDDNSPERLKREALITAAAFPEQLEVQPVKDIDALFGLAHGLLDERHAIRKAIIDGEKSVVTKDKHAMMLETVEDGVTVKRACDVYLSSGVREDTVRLLFVDAGQEPESVANDDVIIMTRGNLKDGITVLLFDKDNLGLYHDANHEQDYAIAKEVIDRISSDIERRRFHRNMNRQRRNRRIRSSVVGAAIGMAAGYSHNVIGEPDLPAYLPVGPAEWILDWNNGPDHKASGYDNPENEVITRGITTELPIAEDYDVHGVPRSWSSGGLDSSTSNVQLGEKPGLWKVDLTQDTEVADDIDPEMLEERVSQLFEDFDCGDLSGESCSVSAMDTVRNAELDATTRCHTVDIILRQDTQLFGTDSSLDGYTYYYDDDFLKLCSSLGVSVLDPEVFIYNP